ncbi:MAG: thiamine diphosphokinase [Clostridia bacterium]|nr:thiamine diphosphokinase [Clostridia bacterium]
MELIERKRCVIVAAGTISDLDILKKNIFYDDYIIAADAGYTKLKSAGIEPHLIVGDFDSSDIPENDVELITLSPVKDYTDTEFAVMQAVDRGYGEILIIGGLGGRIDHSMANIAVMLRYKKQGVNITMVDENHRVFTLANESKVIVKGNYYVSVFAPDGECKVKLEGFYYNNDELTLYPDSSVGVSNEIVDDNAKITALSGTALVIFSNLNM